MSLITADLLVRAGGSPSGAALYAGPLAVACDARGIDSKTSVTAFLANVLNETAALTRVTEDLYYNSPEYLIKVFPSHFKTLAAAQLCARNPAALAREVYGNCQGRGLAMLTGAANYTAYAKASGIGLADVAAYLETPVGAADSAAWFFVWRGCKPLAESANLLGVTRLWEGGQNPIGWPSVQRWNGQVTRAIVGGSTVPGPLMKPVPSISPQQTTDQLNQAQIDAFTQEA